MSASVLQMPMVLRVSVGSKYGAQHSQDWTSIVAHIPGLKVMFPATAYDAKGMLNLALRGTDPVVFFESQRLYPEPETLVEGGVPTEYYEVEMGEPALRRVGADLTIVTVGAALYRALDAARRSWKPCTVLPPKSLMPASSIRSTTKKLSNRLRKPGKVVLVSDACERGSFLHTMASTISQLAFNHLDGPVAVVARAQLDYAARRIGGGVFPPEGVDP